MEDCIQAIIAMMTVVILSAPSCAVSLQISKSGQQCLFQGKWYPANSSFVTSDCKMQCYCMRNGATSCMELCSPQPRGVCPVGMTIRNESEPAGPRGSQCFCIRRYCAADYCINTNTSQKYKIGESFKRGNCSEKCTCTTEGRFKCTPLCPKIQCPLGFKRKDSKKRVKQLADGCSCPKQRCIPKRRRACKYNGRIYTTKHYFETDNCQSKCRCKRNGVIKCVPLCPLFKVSKCGANERLVKTNLPPLHITKGRCQCSKHVCAPYAVARNKSKLPKMKKMRHCSVGNKTLVPGQILITRDCSDRCRCTTFGHLVCVPLCISPPVTCSAHEERVLVRRPVRGSQCSCTRVTCRLKKSSDTQKKECKVDGHVFSQDIEYVDNNCTKRCWCTKAGQAVCRSLCPGMHHAYCQNGYPQYSKQRVRSASWCSCVVKTCLPYIDNRSVNEQ